MPVLPARESRASARPMRDTTRSGGLTRKRSTCPDCGNVIVYVEQSNIKRFQPRLKQCEDCDEVWR